VESARPGSGPTRVAVDTVRAVRPPTAEDLASAVDLVREHLSVTPVMAAGGSLLKDETVLPTGSFKVRGALVAVAAALRLHPGRPVIAASAGNHGLGVAWAADRLGAAATVVVPRTASPAKLAALDRWPADVVRFGSTYDEAEVHALSLAVGGKGTFVSPYNDPAVIAGAATIARELMDEVPDLAGVVVPVGGGGLASGIGLALAGTGIATVGVEAARSPAMEAAVAAGGAVAVAVGPTLADGLAGNIERGSVTVDLVRAHVSALVSVTEDEIMAAMRYLAAEHGKVVEGSGAVALAAVLAGRVGPVGQGTGTLAVVLTGRNIALATLAEALTT
jgi:threonine dehydratase